MLIYPKIDPVAFSIGPLHVHWYGLMYLLGFIGAYVLAEFRVKRQALNWTTEQISDLIFFAAVGVILGGRLGYMLFYQTALLLDSPWVLFRIWEGGMSFHGGLIGVLLALVYFSRKTQKPFLEILDFTAPLIPFGLFAGRIGNFINGELWGRVTDMPWGMVFPMGGEQPRHPSQLYEACLEGVALFLLILWYARRPRPSGRITALFLMGYALCRFVIEFWREPDAQLGFLAFDWLTMGQLLSIPMFIVGFILWWVRRHANIS